MRLWQKTMILLALNNRVKNFIQKNNFANKAARSFVGGNDEIQAIERSIELKSRFIKTSFFSLGEYADQKESVEKTIAILKDLILNLQKDNHDIHISVDPTQIGLIQGYDYCKKNILKLADIINYKDKNIIMLDMEDSSTTDSTISIYESLIQNNFNAGITLQAYLYRTKTDVLKTIENGGFIRLVKGAFAEKKEIAYSSKTKIDEKYLSYSKALIKAKKSQKNLLPVFATHDDKMIEKIIKHSKSLKIDKKDFEFEMLYGVRPALQKDIVEKGYNLRLYLPFGKDWWPYTIRRGGESFNNFSFIIKSIISKK